MKIRPIFAWYDIWIGAYWDRIHWRLYILPIPCAGIVIDFERFSPLSEEERDARRPRP